jgi:hypothetical protein
MVSGGWATLPLALPTARPQTSVQVRAVSEGGHEPKPNRGRTCPARSTAIQVPRTDETTQRADDLDLLGSCDYHYHATDDGEPHTGAFLLPIDDQVANGQRFNAVQRVGVESARTGRGAPGPSCSSSRSRTSGRHWRELNSSAAPSSNRLSTFREQASECSPTPTTGAVDRDPRVARRSRT